MARKVGSTGTPTVFVENWRIQRSGGISGYCDRCGQWSEDLKEVEGQFLCEECRIELSEEEEG